MKEKLKTGAIVILIVLIGLFALFGGKAVKRFNADIASLKSDKITLLAQIAKREQQIILLQDTIDDQEVKIDSCMKEFKKKDKVIAGLTQDLNKALSQLNGITADSSYQFLQKIAYAFPGALKFLFNELQVKGIHADYLTARNAEKIIPEYQDQIDNAKTQIAERDKLTSNLKRMFSMSEQNLSDCQKINQDNEKIIKDVTKERNSERRRKNFWRLGTGTLTIVEILTILALAV